MARILAIGIATLDIINLVPRYPPEDSEIRALEQHVRRGGNATNSLVVLSQLGHRCSWGGVLADDGDLAHILDDLGQHDIDLRFCRRLAAGKNPTSYILLSQATGSRSIVHYRDLPEFSFNDFAAIDLGQFDWIHFEGRNIAETAQMMAHVRRQAPQLPLSLEIEKPRAGMERLYSYPDLLLFSRAFAQAQGYSLPALLFAAVRQLASQADLVCAWGSEGAAALGRDGQTHVSGAFPPQELIETLGAGDTFNAGVIDALLHGRDLSGAIIAGCRLAGRKCGQNGLHGLVVAP